jgi:hypothetical protein
MERVHIPGTFGVGHRRLLASQNRASSEAPGRREASDVSQKKPENLVFMDDNTAQALL